MKNYYENDLYNSNSPQETIEKEEGTDFLKYEYTEIKQILNEKIKELNYTENIYRETLTKFQKKFDELENVNTKLRSLLLEKQEENETLLQQNNDLMRKLNESPRRMPKAADKDYYIDELTNRLKNMENLLKERDEEIFSMRGVMFINIE